MLDTVRAVPAVNPILVVLGAHAERIRAAVDLDDLQVVVADGWQEGISASLRAGVAAAGDADAIVVVLGDQPLITPQVIASVVERLDGAAPAARATFDGAPGHPVLIKRSLFAELGRLRGDSGAKELLEAPPGYDRRMRALREWADVDTPADLNAIGTERAESEVGG